MAGELGLSVAAVTDIAYLTDDGDIVIVGFSAWKRVSFVDEGGAIPDSWQRLVAVPAAMPVATVDTRDVLGLCAPTEADFPALYALRGRRVALVDLGPNV